MKQSQKIHVPIQKPEQNIHLSVLLNVTKNVWNGCINFWLTLFLCASSLEGENLLNGKQKIVGHSGTKKCPLNSELKIWEQIDQKISHYQVLSGGKEIVNVVNLPNPTPNNVRTLKIPETITSALGKIYANQ